GPRCGNGYSTAPWLLWSLPDEPARRLELLLQTIGRELQRFLANAQQSPWPAPGADAHVAVTDTTASLWWGGHDQQLAAIALRPIDRAALGL
ncbi:MAG TPA: hypothetical protein VKV16_11905, partial [Solirubrobacteraceae bacterium]|nr:hypothetical protein [Solirubrobacteraceae bacterium]